MTLKEIRSRVKEIDKCRYSDDKAHCKEDNLFIDFINYVSENGTEELREMANEVLKTTKIKFDRWFS